MMTILRIDGERAGDGDEVLPGDGEIAQPHVRVEIDFELGEDRFGLAAHGPPVEEAETVGDRVAEEDVLGDGQIVEQHRFLMRRGDAAVEGGLGVRNGDRLPPSRMRPSSGV